MSLSEPASAAPPFPNAKTGAPLAPKTILFVDHTAMLSGGELALLELVKHLDQTHYRPVVALFSEGPLAERLREAGVATHILPLSSRIVSTRKDTLGGRSLLRLGDVGSTLGFIVRLARFIRDQRADLVHTNSLKADLLGGLAGRLARRPVLWHIRDRIEDDYLPAPVVRLFRLLCRFIPRFVVANSDSTLATLRLPPGKPSATVYSGVPLPDLDETPPTEGAIRLGLVGRITPWKGQHIFLRAAARVRQEFPQARCLLIGAALFDEKAYEEELHALVAELGMTDATEFLGFRHDIPQLMASLDVLVHASTTGEPFGQVVVQGMAAGKPVVATNGGGVPEIVVEGETGLLVPMNDADALAEAILRLLRAPERAKEMGAKGRRRVQERFTIERTTRRMEEVYAQIISSRL